MLMKIKWSDRKLKTVIITLLIFIFTAGIILISINNRDLYVAADDTALELHPIVEKMLLYLLIENCTITKISPYNNIGIHLEVPDIEDEEVDTYVKRAIEMSGLDYLTTDYLKDRYNIDSLKEFYEYAYNKVEDTKKTALILDGRREVLTSLIEKCTFSLDEDVVANYAIEAVRFYEMDAGSIGFEFENYIVQKFGSKEQFFEYCYSEAETLIKGYLVVGAIAFIENCLVEDFNSLTNYEEKAIYDFYVKLEGEFYKLFITSDENF